jgi:hypothetical protein
MKNFLITLLVAVAAGVVAFGVGYAANTQPALHRAALERDAMAWLRTEFQLNDAQYASIGKLHDDYGLVCGEHCTAIMAAKKRNAPAAEIGALEKICVNAMMEHFQRVAALMPPGQGARYLAIVRPRVDDYDHAAAPTVQVKP